MEISQLSPGSTRSPRKDKHTETRTRKNTLRHMGIKLTKFKDRGKILKATGKRGRNKVTPSRVSADFSTETVQDTVSGERTYNQEFSIQQDSPSDLSRN